ncbi:unnamed protein product [Caenorhabditis bovis]|uniref:Uncharacterized protein n=1 Tax=Caenorhabditis bovis TaxID=2654633 RepID=A0A8S1F3X3_9PELO|nr:unnamed protein product [Caenorhabditis bovis]
MSFIKILDALPNVCEYLSRRDIANLRETAKLISQQLVRTKTFKQHIYSFDLEYDSILQSTHQIAVLRKTLTLNGTILIEIHNPVEGETEEEELAKFAFEQLREVTIYGKLRLAKLRLDSMFYKNLTAKCVDLGIVTTMDFTQCKLEITPAEFNKLLHGSKISTLIIQHCEMSTDLISDELFEGLKYIEAVTVRLLRYTLCNRLTEKLIQKWIDCEPSNFPRYLVFYNCKISTEAEDKFLELGKKSLALGGLALIAVEIPRLKAPVDQQD